MTKGAKTIRVGEKLMDLSRPRVMGIVNLTPDSFYAESRASYIGEVLTKSERLLNDGADILDFGAMSTRPGAKELTTTEEIDRLIGPLMAVRAQFPDALISVDTYRRDVLSACLDCRINMVNDISAGKLDPGLIELVGKSKLAYVLMHMLGVPRTMQDHIEYDDVVLDMMKFFAINIDLCRKSGVTDIVIDPGFGFGKSLQHNFQLLRQLQSLEIFDCPIMVGISRKSMVYKTLGLVPEQALNGTTALHMLSLLNGATFLRVHDVREAVECIKLFELYNNS